MFFCVAIDLNVTVNSLKPFGVVIVRQDWVLCALLSSCKIFRAAFSKIKLPRSSHKLCDILSDFNKVGSVSTDFRKKSPISNFTKIHLVAAALMPERRRKEGQT